MTSSENYTRTHVRESRIAQWKRYPLKVKVSIHGHSIASEIDILAFRPSRPSHRPPAIDFKPFPEGFNQDRAHARKALPKGEHV